MRTQNASGLAGLFRNGRTEFPKRRTERDYGRISASPRPRHVVSGGKPASGGHAGGAFCGCCRGVQAAQRPDARAHFLAAQPSGGLRHQSGRHAGDVQPGRVAPSALPDGKRPARQPPRRQGGLLPRGRHGGEPSAARDRRARHGDRLPGEGRGLSGLAGGDHPPRAHLSHGASFRAHHDRGAVARVSDEYNDAEKRLQARLRLVHRAAYEAAPHGGGRRTPDADAGRHRGHCQGRRL